MKNTKHRKHALLIQPTLQLKYKKNFHWVIHGGNFMMSIKSKLVKFTKFYSEITVRKKPKNYRN